jgi:hypothetical protein
MQTKERANFGPATPSSQSYNALVRHRESDCVSHRGDSRVPQRRIYALPTFRPADMTPRGQWDGTNYYGRDDPSPDPAGCER